MNKNWAIRGTLALSLLGSVALPGMAQVATDGKADEADKHKTSVSSVTKSVATPRLRDRDRPATTVKDWIAQMEAATVQVTNIKLEVRSEPQGERTEAGLDITLETAEGKPLQVDATKFRRDGNNLIAEIPNAVLALPQGQPFVADNPTADIATVQVVQQEGTIRVSVAGNNALPKTEVTLKTGGLAYSLNPEGDEADEEIVVTGEREGYRVPNTSVGTRTDTPLRDIPQAINIVPRQVIRDTQARGITQAVENVPGVISTTSAAFNRDYFLIRGFESFNALINGLPDVQTANDSTFINVERVEVLKGPASALFGESSITSIGGTINYVTRRPLREPFFEVEAIAGNNNSYQGTIDISGPLNPDKTVLGRFIAGYTYNDTFVDFNTAQTIAFAPSLSFQLGNQTKLIIEGDVNIVPRGESSGYPVIGTVLPNPNGKIPLSFNGNGPLPVNTIYNGRVGYSLEHILYSAKNWTFLND
jgi:iron complex outermembrane receptor protein